MAQIYRKSALERLSSPDQLDKALTVISPMSWLALAAAAVAVAVVIIWSIVGTLPVTVTASGIVASPDKTNAIYTGESGTVLSVNVNSGAQLQNGDLILTYQLGNGTVRELLSDQKGTVGSISVKAGDSIIQGNEVLRVSPNISDSKVVVCYVKVADAKKIELGMKANISLASADSQTYGHMIGQVINMDSYASSTTGMSYVLGSDNNLAAAFQENGAAVVAVTFEIGKDSGTASGYYWSNEKGKELAVSNGSLVSAKIIIEEIPPISKLFTKIKEIWGD